MRKKLFSRIYTDNTKYGEDKHNYFDALAFTVQKHLFTRKKAVYFLGGTFDLWDFMTLTRYYIKASTSDYGLSEIESYISAMDEPYAQAFGGDAVEYTKDAKGIIVHATPANIMSMLWAAWIYARVASDIANDKNKRIWQRAAEQLYTSMEDYYDDPEHKRLGEKFEDNRLIGMSDEAMKTMVKYILAHDAKQAQRPQPEPAREQQVSTGEDIAQLQARIKELEAENMQLKKQLNAAPLEDEEIESLRNDLLAFKTMGKRGKASPMLTSKQMAIFLKAILLKHRSLTNNVKSLAPLLQKFGGWTTDTATNALGYKVKQEECDELAKAFSPYAPSISKIITDFPKEYDKIKVQKLSANLNK